MPPVAADEASVPFTTASRPRRHSRATIGYAGGIAPETMGPRIPDDMAAETSARLALEATRAVMNAAGVGG